MPFTPDDFKHLTTEYLPPGPAYDLAKACAAEANQKESAVKVMEQNKPLFQDLALQEEIERLRAENGVLRNRTAIEQELTERFRSERDLAQAGETKAFLERTAELEKENAKLREAVFNMTNLRPSSHFREDLKRLGREALAECNPDCGGCGEGEGK